MKPFRPVDNGNQHLSGLDDRTAMWRGDEYPERSMPRMDEFPDLFEHLDHDTLTRV